MPTLLRVQIWHPEQAAVFGARSPDVLLEHIGQIGSQGRAVAIDPAHDPHLVGVADALGSDVCVSSLGHFAGSHGRTILPSIWSGTYRGSPADHRVAPNL